MARSSSPERVVAQIDPSKTVQLAKDLIETAKVKSAEGDFWFPHGINQLSLSVSISREGATVSIELGGPPHKDPSRTDA